MNHNPMSFESLFGVGQIKLSELSVCNWGSFHNIHTVAIDPDGTLVTGDNGAGKSTLIDGLMALLLPPGKAKFNVAAAQGDSSDRNLMSYIRGSFGSEQDGSQTSTMNKRTGATSTVLRAVYRSDDGKIITLAAMFWTTKPTSSLSDLKRIYLVAQRDVKIQEIHKAFGDNNPRALKQYLKSDKDIQPYADSFNEYQEAYCRALHIENRNAPGLLARALGLKKIEDLTSLIRSLVLEPSHIREDAQGAVEEFEELNKIHDLLLDARKREETLIKLPEVNVRYEIAIAKSEALVQQRENLNYFIAKQCFTLYGIRLGKILEIIKQHEVLLELAKEKEKLAQTKMTQCYADYHSAGGDRIDAIKEDVKRAKDKLAVVTKNASAYQKMSRELLLNHDLRLQQFTKNQTIANDTLAHSEELLVPAMEKVGASAGKLQNKNTEFQEANTEYREIKSRPDSNIPAKYQHLREEICSSLEIPKEELMFIGELIDIKEDEKLWQGAIERALGGIKLTLAAPSHKYHLITKWLNARHTSLHVRVQVVEKVSGTSNFKTDGFLRKLGWRNHAYREWVKQFLAHHDLHCVADVETLDKTPYSMTQQGLVQLKQGRFEKKDNTRINDTKNWHIGFSNKSRLSSLESLMQELGEAISKLNDEKQLADKEYRALNDRLLKLRQYIEYSWIEIDTNSKHAAVKELETELLELLSIGGELNKAERLFNESEERLSECKKKTSNEQRMLDTKKQDHVRCNSTIENLKHDAQVEIEKEVDKQLFDRVGLLNEDDLKVIDRKKDDIRIQIDKQHDVSNKEVQICTGHATRIMAQFLNSWQVIATDWGTDLRSIPEYLSYLEELQTEGLPGFVEEFKQRLNKNSIQTLVNIRGKISSEREDIVERISIINDVLVKTEFRRGTYLRLESRRENWPNVVLFEKKLQMIIGSVNNDEHEKRFAQLREVIDILQKASDTASYQLQDSQRLLDPRHQISFSAKELDKKTEEVKDIWDSSSGKSGGEKESFAGVIVAASLAYVLTPDGCDRPIYSTVFLDEAFSNTSESVSRRVLAVFKKLKIHVNLITPYKNLNLARESANSLIIAERDKSLHESRLSEVTWETIDERIRNEQEALLSDEGIVIEEIT
jgi:uncharacterized protein YPO0396